MINMQGELNDTRRLIWQVRSYIGRDLFGPAAEDIRCASIVCDTIARFSNHLSNEQLKELKDLSEQCIDILQFLDNKVNS